MSFIKAAAAAGLACIIGAGMSLTAMAQAVTADDVMADSQEIELVSADPKQDGEYLKFKHEQIAEAFGSKSPAGKIKRDYTTVCEFGSYLYHDTRFNGMERTFCIDVSQWQSNIDWNAVKRDGINKTIIRLGVRGYGSAGTLMMDDKFYQNINGAKAAGLEVGVYFYTQAINVWEAQQEADYCANALSGYSLELPVYFDIESVDFAYGRLDHAGLNKDQKTELCKAFCDRIESYGYQSGVYANLNWLTWLINGPELGQNYKTWVAAYQSSLNYPGIYDMWQYSSSAQIDGIYGNVDISVCYDVDYAPADTVNVDIDNGVISWNPVSGADGYTVYGADADGSNSFVISDTKGTQFDISGQSAAKFCVAAYNYYSGARYYGNSSAYVDGFRGTVSDVEVERSGIDEVDLSWGKVDEAVGYKVYTSRGGDYEYDGKTTSERYTVEGENLENVTVKIRPYNENGVEGGWSEEIALPGNYPVETPHMERMGTKLMWTALDDADGYIVTFTDAEGGSEEFFADTNSMFIDDSKTGSYTVQSYYKLDGQFMRSPASNACGFKGISYPPAGEVKLDSGDGELVWNRIDDALGYVVYELTAEGNDVEVARVNECRYSSDDLTGTVYFVKAYNAKNDEEFFTEASNRIVISLPEVTEAKLDALTDDHAVISWNSIEGCSEYMVYLDMGTGYKLYSTVKGSMAVIGGLKDAEFASVRVKGYVGDEEVLSFGAFSNQLYIIGDEETRPQQEVFSFDDLIKK